MPFLSPRFGVTTGVATVMAKGIKKGMVPESRLSTSETVDEGKTGRAEQLPQSRISLGETPAKPGFLNRLRGLILRR